MTLARSAKHGVRETDDDCRRSRRCATGCSSSRSKRRQDALAEATDGWRGRPGLDDGTGHSGACVLRHGIAPAAARSAIARSISSIRRACRFCRRGEIV